MYCSIYEYGECIAVYRSMVNVLQYILYRSMVNVLQYILYRSMVNVLQYIGVW